MKVYLLTLYHGFDDEDLCGVFLSLESAKADVRERDGNRWCDLRPGPRASMDLLATLADRGDEWRIYATDLRGGAALDPMKQLALKILEGDPQATDLAQDVIARGA